MDKGHKYIKVNIWFRRENKIFVDSAISAVSAESTWPVNGDIVQLQGTLFILSKISLLSNVLINSL